MTTSIKNIFIYILLSWIYFFISSGVVKGQNNISTLLQSKAWVFCWSDNSLIAFDSLTINEQEKCRFQFEFLKNGKIKYKDLLVGYDSSIGCSNSFSDFSGTWSTLNGKVYIQLEYNIRSQHAAFVTKYIVKYKSSTELLLTVTK